VDFFNLFKIGTIALGFSTKLFGEQTPQTPPELQCLQYLQFLHAEQYFEPVHLPPSQGLATILNTLINKRYTNFIMR
jgi:hypothetical protein